MAIDHAAVGASHIRLVVRRYARLLHVLRGVLRFNWHLCVNARIEVRVRVQWGIRMVLVQIVGVLEVAAVVGSARPPQPGDTIRHRALESAAAVLVAQLAAPAAVHPDGNNEIAEFQHVYKMRATEVWE